MLNRYEFLYFIQPSRYYIGSFLVAKQSKDWNFIKYITKRMLIYQHSFSFQMVSRK